MDERGGNRWWEKGLSREDIGRRALEVYRVLVDQDGPRRSAYRDYLRLYGNLSDLRSPSAAYVRPVLDDRITYNVIAKWCDKATSRIGKQRPMPVVLPRGGSYELQRRARLLGRFFEAQFRISRAYQATRQQFLDATVFGAGVIHPYHDGSQIRVERVFPAELLVDHREATLGEPRQMMREKHVSRDVLRAMFLTDGLDKRERARRAKVIEDAGCEERPDEIYGYEGSDKDTSDLVLVVEAHRLPSGPGAGDGLHAFFTDAGLLEAEPYEEECFPYVITRWKRHPARFWGIGLAEELLSVQVEMNLMLMKIQEAYRLMAKPFILADLSFQFVKGGFDADIGTVARYSGQAPQIWTPNAFHPEFYAHFDRLDRIAGETSGFSQEQSSPQEIRSQVQLSLNHDIETERFSITALDFEDGIEDLAAWMVRLAKQLDAQGGWTTVAAKDRYSLENIDWSEIDLKEDQYTLGIRNVNQLSTLFAERVNQVGNLMALGLVTDPQQALELIDLPDLDRDRDMRLAPSRNIDRIAELILDEGRFVGPEPTMDLQLGLQKMTDLLNWAQCQDDIEEEKLTAIRDWLTSCTHLQARAQLEQAKSAAMAAGGLSPDALPPGPGAPPGVGNAGAPPTAPAGPPPV